MSEPAIDLVTETLVMSFLDLIAERKLAGKPGLAATMTTIANWLTERTKLPLEERHIAILVAALAEAGIISVGGQGIGKPNVYTTREEEMGPTQFWNQVDALLHIWRHPSRKTLSGE